MSLLEELGESAMAAKPRNETKPADLRGKIVEALMQLAAERRFEDISIRDICGQAGVSLADFRDAFPSKGAVLAGFSRKIDRAVLSEQAEDLADESARERLFDILMRRLEAMAPYREGVREVMAYLKRDLGAAFAMNQVVLNSMRFMMEAAGIETDGGAAGAIKLQGLALAWARIVGVWLDDDDPGLSKTMAEVDRELTSRRARRRGRGSPQQSRFALANARAGSLRGAPARAGAVDGEEPESRAATPGRRGGLARGLKPEHAHSKGFL